MPLSVILVLHKLLVHVLKRWHPFEARSEKAYRAHRAQLVELDPPPCTGRLREQQQVDRMRERRGRCGIRLRSAGTRWSRGGR